MVIFKNKDDNIYKIIRNIWILIFHKDILFIVSFKFWNFQISKWFTSIFTKF